MYIRPIEKLLLLKNIQTRITKIIFNSFNYAIMTGLKLLCLVMRTTMITSMLSFHEMGCLWFSLFLNNILQVGSSYSWSKTRNISADFWYIVKFPYTNHLVLFTLFLGRLLLGYFAEDHFFWFYETPKLPLITLVFEYVCHCVVPKGTKSK